MGWNRCISIMILTVILGACTTTIREDSATLVLDLPIDDCSIAPSRTAVLIQRLDPYIEDHYQVYSLITKQPIIYPDANKYTYGKSIDWVIGSPHDILIVEPHWLIDFTSMVVTDTRTIDPSKNSLWWQTGPRLIDQRISPDGLYRIERGTVWFEPTPGASRLTPTIVSIDNPFSELCGNAWEPDSSGIYLIDYVHQARSIEPGPLRFLPITP